MKKVFAISALSLAILSGCTTTSNKQLSNSNQVSLLSDTLVVSPNDTRQYETLALENGIEVLLISDPNVDKSAAALSVGVGLLNDPMTQQGMAHYLEHMLFLGTEKYPDTKGYTDFMSNNGGQHNAYTWLDITNYMFKVNNDAYDEALDRFSDFFKAPKLYAEYTEKEKNAVNAEWSMRREMDFFGQFKLARNMMGDHPANRFLIGNLETLGDKKESTLHQETVDFYNKYYSSNIMKLAMISNEPLAKMKEKAQKHFSSIENKNIDDPRITTSLDFDKVGKKLVHYTPNEDVKQLVIDFTIEDNSEHFAVKPNYFITYLLSNEMEGSPAQLLKNKGWIASLSASASPKHYGNYGALQVHISLTDEGMKHREEITGTVLKYIDLIKEQGVDSKYFKEIQTSLNNQFRFLEKGDEFGYVSNLADSMQKYPLNHVINAGFHYTKFDKNAVNQVLSQLTSERLKVWHISKEEPTDSKLYFYDGEYQIKDFSNADVSNWKSQSIKGLALPSVNNLLPEKFDLKTTEQDVGVKLKIDKGHIKVWHTASPQFQNQPKGAIEVYLNSEQANNSIENVIALSLWSDLYTIDKAKLATEAGVAGMNLSLSPANGLVLNISGFTDKQPVLLRDALANLTLNVSEIEFKQAVDRYQRGIANAGKQFPYSQAFSAYSGSIRSGNFDSEALIKAAGKLTLAQFQAAQSSLLEQYQARVFAFGNYDEASLQVVVDELGKALSKPKVNSLYERSKYWLPEPGQTLSWKKDIEVADVGMFDVYIHPEKGPKSQAQAMILAEHFSTAIFESLRTQEQLAYAVGAADLKVDEYAGIGLFIQTPVKDPAAMQKRFDAFKLEYLEQLDKLDEKTFQQIKSSALLSLKETPKNLSQEMGELIRDWYKENWSFDTKAKLISALENVTLDEVKAFYHESVLNSDAARLNIQLRGSKFKDKPFATLPNAIEIKSYEDLYKHIKFQ